MHYDAALLGGDKTTGNLVEDFASRGRPLAVFCGGQNLKLCLCVTDEDSTVLVNGDVLTCEEPDCEASVSARQVTDGGSSPGAQRRKRLCKLRDSLKCRDSVDIDRSNADADNIYTDNLPEVFIRPLAQWDFRFDLFFTARAYARAVLGVVILSVRPSVCHTRGL